MHIVLLAASKLRYCDLHIRKKVEVSNSNIYKIFKMFYQLKWLLFIHGTKLKFGYFHLETSPEQV